jgi:hypothetical protein
MYGLETIRGGMSAINTMADSLSSFLMIDWSRFDHLAPFIIIDFFFDKYAPQLLLVDNGYAQIHNYMDHIHSFAAQAKEFGINQDTSKAGIPPTEEVFASKLENIISFLKRWYKEMVYVTPDGFAYRRNYAGVPSGILLTQFIDSFVNLTLLLDAMIEFGFSDEEIKAFILMVMGDDNVIFSSISIFRLNAFFAFFTAYALSRFGMIVNIDKSKITSLRKEIEVLGYSNNHGMPERDISKLVGQLAFPERHVNDEDMCMRAIGFAYTSCGQSTTFHNLCKSVFFHYYARVNLPMEDLLTKSRYGLPGMFYAYDDVTSHIKLDHFPTIDEVRNVVSIHHGFLTEEPTWKYDYFVNPPNPERPTAKTLAQLRSQEKAI